ncbi:MAG: 2-C-methyl-D-erythritol 4-phosphate cytidylyltransferase [Prevotella sp.]|nr:2-C-methyl-D-erythritol 4-phosphate cytidylyltransferase [Bacteroides sp.]MCM1365983.1 2-C-methyl-D-erythritol 4-phosphate cytidylyltransferase [Prevotella sp.]MCM1436596.1 2-C-methyl-D-erythritol 4-phosphate cytidylyltransferase [Prevotella sp.]
MLKYCLIMAGGAGVRAGGNVPKQMQCVNGVPMLLWSIAAFRREDANVKIIVVLNKDCQMLWDDISTDYVTARGVEICYGGKDRLQSVINGLEYIRIRYGVSDDSYVAVHDAARPMVRENVIKRGWDMAIRNGSAIPVVTEANSLRFVDGEDSSSVDRSKYRIVQTPQVFKVSELLDAYKGMLLPEYTDDASVYESSGRKVSLYEGDPANFKVTTPVDFVLAEAVLKNRGKDGES